MQATRTPMDKFAASVDAGVCMEWTGDTRDGYGRFRDADRRLWSAHRWLWTQVYGPIPDGLVIDHLCRNRACVDPLHLRLTTNRVNVLAGYGISALNLQKTHCKSGHEFTPENTVRWSGKRQCRTCTRKWAREAELRRQTRGRSRAKA